MKDVELFIEKLGFLKLKLSIGIPSKLEKYIKDYNNGLSTYDLADKHNTTQAKIHAYFKENNIKLRTVKQAVQNSYDMGKEKEIKNFILRMERLMILKLGLNY